VTPATPGTPATNDSNSTVDTQAAAPEGCTGNKNFITHTPFYFSEAHDDTKDEKVSFL
jgi:hypothetical protein